MIVPPLRRKVLRDLRRLWAQALAIALVLAAGVATLILGHGAHDALEQTRARYYAEYRFADVFAGVTRAPEALLAAVAAIGGVVQAEGRIVKTGIPELPGLVEPGMVMLVSLPRDGGLNRTHLRQGRLPDPQAPHEALVSEGFAAAHGLQAGDGLAVLMNGQRRQLRITGIALSPEFIYAIGPGEMMPDPRRFGILWLPRGGLETAFDLKGAVSDVVVKLAPGADEGRVIAALDRLLAPYGGTGAHGRKDQTSHAFLDAEIEQIGAMAAVLPPVFLAVAALLVNMTLGRLVTLEREQIGLLKAIGYGRRAIGQHYVEFVLAIALVGIAIGFAAGGWLASELAQIYAQFFSFPFLLSSAEPRIYAMAALVTLAAAVAGALRAVHGVAVLPPAVAMAPPAPPVYGHAGAGLARLLRLRQGGVMILRHLGHWPLRTAASLFGVAMAVAILVASLWTFGSIDRMLDITFSRAERHDAQVVFAGETAPAALHAARAFPGVMAAEPFRLAEARISHRGLSRRVAITGKPAEPRLSRVLAPDLTPMPLPEAGLILSEALAEALRVRPGDRVQVAFLSGRRASVTLPVSGLSVGYVGLGAAMEIGALDRAMGGGARISGVNLLTDPAARGAFFAAVAAAPRTGAVSVTSLTVQRFRATLAENIVVMVTVYVVLAGIVAIGVVYNFARISLSEQGRELASLRVLGFTRAEVAGILLRELAVVVVLAQPLGWGIGHLVGRAMAAAFSSDLYRIPFVMGPEVYASASIVVCAAALVSAVLIRRRVDGLDMIEVLKTRE